MTPLHHPHQNDLLASLPAADYAPLAAALECVPLRLGDMVYVPGEPPSHLVFPITAVVSLHYVMASGCTAQTAGVGHEGVVGIAMFMGGGTTASSAVVHTSGHGFRLPRALLMQQFERGGALQLALLRYTQVLITQISQTAACYRHHSVEQQLSGWLMAAQDRLVAGELVMTQELLASLLGVRRESITQAAGRLQELGHIRYRRGHITVLDPTALRATACECYGVVKAEMGRLAPAGVFFD
jgi:CRP-like cAMP-binding protein